MLLRHITSYDQFVKHGRPYYPTEAKGRLLLSHIEINVTSAAFGSKRRLAVWHYPLVNRGGLVAVQCAWLSRYGYRVRWFYWQDGKRVTFHRLTWDNKRKICRKWREAVQRYADCDHDYPPTRHYLDYVLRKGML